MPSATLLESRSVTMQPGPALAGAAATDAEDPGKKALTTHCILDPVQWFNTEIEMM